MSEQYWTVCQTFAGREHLVRAEIEKINRGAMVLPYARTWVSDGKVSSGERAVLQGYVFFLTDSKDWDAVAEIEGVQQVLTCDRGDGRMVAKQVRCTDIARMVVDHFTGYHDDMAVCMDTGRPARERGRSRKPRRSKRIRKVTVSNRTDIAA